MQGASGCKTSGVRRTIRLSFAVMALFAVSCSSGVGDAVPATTTSPGSPDPPWRTEPPIAATGLNARLLADFRKSDGLRAGCEPLGIDTDVWDPPDSFEWTGFIYISRYEPTEGPSKQERLKKGDRSVTKWSDNSFSSNVLLVDGTFRFDVEIPVNGAGRPGDWCTYIYSPSSPSETGAKIVRSLRFIEQPGQPSGSPVADSLADERVAA